MSTHDLNTLTNPEPQPEQQQNLSQQMIQDRQVIAEKFPRNTQEMEFQGVTGWSYTLTNEFSDQYTMFAYNDGDRYQVIVLFPEDAVQYSQQNAYILDDGRIVINSEIGFSTLKQAFAISVLWAVSFSAFKKTGMFPFSINSLKSPSEQTALLVQEFYQITPPDYDEGQFWQKLTRYALMAGKNVIFKALTLYYATQSPLVPTWAKTIIYSALAYFILPADLIPDALISVGYIDDLGVLVSAFLAVDMCITPGHQEAANNKLQQWFSSVDA